MNQINEPVSTPESLEGRKFQRPEPEVLIGRALRLKCPRCGQGKLYSNYRKMNDACSNCRLSLLREPGYYLGATYMNYGVTALSITGAFILFRIVLNYPTDNVVKPLAVFSILFPLLFFRHARALWLAFDCQFDSSLMEE